ncbi:hypothetical protein [Shewanella sp. KCT]|uniref:hypothetical protein n=1 Tax=Shewanella sp. KCT TaxID=2569535 RepID=UPI001182DFED|nr:hypothetical protein [Shewanella sp. KCT]TVP08750.1 hypothetical protein AYI87_20915 [Shewanella sp. KCT]
MVNVFIVLSLGLFLWIGVYVGLKFGALLAQLYIVFSKRYAFIGYGEHNKYGRAAIFVTQDNGIHWVVNPLCLKLVDRYCHAE